MKKIQLLSITIVLILVNFICNAQTGNQAKVQAYYFHNATRCVTCKTVEAEAKTDLKELYGDKVSFQALNLEDKATVAVVNDKNF